MNPNDRPYYYQNSLRWSQSYGTGASGWRKRQIINAMMDDLHTQQMAMIDAAVEASDMADAKQVIEWIMQK